MPKKIAWKIVDKFIARRPGQMWTRHEWLKENKNDGHNRVLSKRKSDIPESFLHAQNEVKYKFNMYYGENSHLRDNELSCTLYVPNGALYL